MRKVLENTFEESTLRQVADGIPDGSWPHWLRYENELEQKRTTRDVWRMNDATCRLFAWLNSFDFVGLLSDLTGIKGLMPDPILHGAGIHVLDNGGRLGSHLDYNLHPVLGLERRINCVLFLNREWRQEWGGALEFYADDGTTLIESVIPSLGRMCVWENTDIAYHGTQQVCCPVGACRVTAMVSYLTLPRASATRKRALFVPVR